MLCSRTCPSVPSLRPPVATEKCREYFLNLMLNSIIYIREKTVAPRWGLLLPWLRSLIADTMATGNSRSEIKKFPPATAWNSRKFPVSMACFKGPPKGPNIAEMRHFDGRQVLWGKEKKGNAISYCKRFIVCGAHSYEREFFCFCWIVFPASLSITTLTGHRLPSWSEREERKKVRVLTPH